MRGVNLIVGAEEIGDEQDGGALAMTGAGQIRARVVQALRDANVVRLMRPAGADDLAAQYGAGYILVEGIFTSRFVLGRFKPILWHTPI